MALTKPQRSAALVAAAAALAITVGLLVDAPLHARTGMVATFCLFLWLTEATPPFVPTLILLVGAPLLVGPVGEGVALSDVLGWGADPVLALFFGGFSLGTAARTRGVDRALAALVVRAARGRRRVLVLLVLGATAILSMWISNIAAAALMLAALGPVLEPDDGGDGSFKRATLLAVAFGANFGGMATPIGTGPNAIAIAALAERTPVTFGHWVLFALPLTVLVLVVTAAALFLRFRMRGLAPMAEAGSQRTPLDRAGWAVIGVFVVSVVLWLSEPLHDIPSAVVALGAAATLFATGLLRPKDLGKLDWSTLILVAGGIMLGRLLEAAQLFAFVGDAVRSTGTSSTTQILMLVMVAAVLSALMSNTATATLLVPLAWTIDPASATPILVAMGCSFGMPFVISTPPNAMAVGAGLPSKDLLWLGLPLMVFGTLLVTFTGPRVLAALGVG